MVTYDRDIGQLSYRQRESFSAAENGVGRQEHNWPGELRITLRFEIPGLQGFKVIVARANLGLSMKGHTRTVAKPIDDSDRVAVVPAGTIPDVDDETLQLGEVTADLVQSSCQLSLFNAFQLENSEVAELRRSAIAKQPSLGLFRLSESIGEESLLGRLEELLDP